MKDLGAAVVAIIGIVIGLFAYLAAAIAFRALALMWLWAWFVTPFGLPQIELWHAAGISSLVAFLTYEDYNHAEGKKGMELVGTLSYTFLISGFALFFGYIFHNLMT